MKPVRQIAVLLPAAVLILASGCATKDWVRDALQRKSVELGQQVEGVDQRVDTVGQRVDTVDQKVVVVDGCVTQEVGRIDKVGTRVDKVEGMVIEVGETAKGVKKL